jgi:hypothetical protein
LKELGEACNHFELRRHRAKQQRDFGFRENAAVVVRCGVAGHADGFTWEHGLNYAEDIEKRVET